jgi:hypothetical protein
VAAKRTVSGDIGKRKVRRAGAGTPAPDMAKRTDRERRPVDVDPWAVLLKQLMEVPEEEPTGRTSTRHFLAAAYRSTATTSPGAGIATTCLCARPTPTTRARKGVKGGARRFP